MQRFTSLLSLFCNKTKEFILKAYPHQKEFILKAYSHQKKAGAKAKKIKDEVTNTKENFHFLFHFRSM